MFQQPEWAKGAPKIKRIPGPRAKEIIDRDERVISQSCTREDPLVGEEGYGVYVRDVDGNVFLDLSSGMFVLNYGYSNPEIVEAIKQQTERLAHFAGTDFYHELQVRLAEKLVSITPGNFKKRAFFSNSGAESVEAAFKCARWHTRRPRMIAFEGGFHGRTLGALSLTSHIKYSEHFAPLVPGVSFMPFPNPYRPFGGDPSDCSARCIEYLKKSLKRDIPPEEVAAIITEPIQGTAGYIIPPPDFYPMLRELCEEHGWLFIADEVQTGLGRSGKMFAIEHWGVTPDIICMAKALAGGMIPMGATVAKEEVMDWEPGSHANTFGGNLLACSAALAGLNILERDKLADRAAKLGKIALKKLEEMKEKHELIGDVRGKGLLLAVELVKDRKTKEPAVKEREAVMRAALNKGVILFRGGASSIRIAPSLTIKEEELNLGLDLFEQAIAEVGRK
jgi:4-aminobutyrate aminotransferase